MSAWTQQIVFCLDCICGWKKILGCCPDIHEGDTTMQANTCFKVAQVSPFQLELEVNLNQTTCWIARLLQQFWILYFQDTQLYLVQTAPYHFSRIGEGLTTVWLSMSLFPLKRCLMNLHCSNTCNVARNLGEIPSWTGNYLQEHNEKVRLVNQLTCAQCRSYELQILCVYCLWNPPLFGIALAHWPWSYAKDSGLVLTDWEFSILLEKNRVLWQGHRITLCFHRTDCCQHFVPEVSCFTSQLCGLFNWPWSQIL